jgi:hypothetical protein
LLFCRLVLGSAVNQKMLTEKRMRPVAPAHPARSNREGGNALGYHAPSTSVFFDLKVRVRNNAR